MSMRMRAIAPQQVGTTTPTMLDASESGWKRSATMSKRHLHTKALSVSLHIIVAQHAVTHLQVGQSFKYTTKDQ